MFVESFSVIVLTKSIEVFEEGKMLKYKPSFFLGEKHDVKQNKKIHQKKLKFFIKKMYEIMGIGRILLLADLCFVRFVCNHSYEKQ